MVPDEFFGDARRSQFFVFRQLSPQLRGSEDGKRRGVAQGAQGFFGLPDEILYKASYLAVIFAIKPLFFEDA